MSRTENIIDLLNVGIRAETLRQKTIANNVANQQTPGYRRIDIRFKELLAKSLDSNGNVDLSKIKAEIYQPRTTAVQKNGNDVNLETEVGQMVKNTLRHKAYVRLLKKKYTQIDQAINIR